MNKNQNNHITNYVSTFRQKGIEGLEPICTEIQKFKSLDELKNIQYTGCFVDSVELPMLGLKYEMDAKDFFPSVRQRLIDKKIITPSNIIYTSHYNKNTNDEAYNIHLRYYGSKFQLSIDFKKK